MNKFKRVLVRFKRVLVIGFAMAVCAVAVTPAVQAQGLEKRTFSGTSTDIGVTNTYFVVSGHGAGFPVLQYISATSDKSGSVVTFRKPVSAIQLTAAADAAATAVTAVGTTFAANDVCILRNVSSDLYQRLVVSASTATNVTFNEALTRAAAVGDILYEVTAAGTIPVGAATKEVVSSGGGLYHGQVGLPLLIDLDGTNAAQINVVSGTFER